MEIAPLCIAGLLFLAPTQGVAMNHEKDPSKAKEFRPTNLRDIGIFLGGKVTPEMIENHKFTVNDNGTKYQFTDKHQMLEEATYSFTNYTITVWTDTKVIKNIIGMGDDLTGKLCDFAAKLMSNNKAEDYKLSLLSAKTSRDEFQNVIYSYSNDDILISGTCLDGKLGITRLLIHQKLK